ncbi:OsmC family protein [Pararhizobium sp. IMCC21322]|uniref:OsmC family protein n=1 Tax=Pararhizobium sp. IMCC21322 TaxID=3067903 RepID=UPI0027404314|nr:OsmC family protein [Pararhizobium sp. IMCC21322]
MKKSENVIETCGLPLVFRLGLADAAIVPAAMPRRAEAIRVFATSLSGYQKEALVKSARTGMTWRLVSDEGENLNGHDAAPPPLGFFAAGLLAGYMEEMTALAIRRNVSIRTLNLTLDNFYTMKGSMPRRTMVGGAQSVELTVAIDCDLTGAALQQFLADAIHAAPQNGFVRKSLNSIFTLTKNGQRLAPARVEEMDVEPPANSFTNDAAKDLAPGTAVKTNPVTGLLLQSAGMSPPSKTHVAKGSAENYSTANPPPRPLHVAATATLRDDGLKEVFQQLHFPHSSQWRFLSEEAPVNGGMGRAPDANTLISAGIGFCFMTQLGILAETSKLDLPSYSIYQDTHFSLGGASGGTQTAGDADAVETHLRLSTSESDQLAQEMLDLAEQACFLHALCSKPLKTKLRVLEIR